FTLDKFQPVSIDFIISKRFRKVTDILNPSAHKEIPTVGSFTTSDSDITLQWNRIRAEFQTSDDDIMHIASIEWDIFITLGIVIFIGSLSYFHQGIEDNHEIQFPDFLFLWITFQATRFNQYRTGTPRLEIIPKSSRRIGIIIFSNRIWNILLQYFIHAHDDLHGPFPNLIDLTLCIIGRCQ